MAPLQPNMSHLFGIFGFILGELIDLEEAFEMYNDTEMFGFITPKSLQRMLGRLGESKSMEQCTTMIGHFDLNGDGLLCFDEFRVMMQ